jgi:hypothetical protein
MLSIALFAWAAIFIIILCLLASLDNNFISTSIRGCLIFSLLILVPLLCHDIGNAREEYGHKQGYKQGQIDAIKGDIKYQKVHEEKWELIPEKE